MNGVIIGSTRITFITERLIRIEHSITKQFEDRPSISFATRNKAQPVQPKHTTIILQISACEKHILETQYVKLELINDGKMLSNENLTVDILSIPGQTWFPGKEPSGNLLGTIKSLDRTEGFVDLRELKAFGVCSLDGWALIDDSNSGIFLENEQLVSKRWKHLWCFGRNCCDTTDWYLFAYGHDFKAAVSDLVLISGQVPMIPRWIFGVWHSQWFPFSQQQLIETVKEFERSGVSLDVVTLDMDFHTTMDGNQPSFFNNWGGFTWETRLFPDSLSMVEELHQIGTRFAINIHPADGIPCFERHYAECCKFLNFEPKMDERGKGIPFDCSNPRWCEAFVDIALQDLHADIPWIDYQASEDKLQNGVSPTLWLSHIICFPKEGQIERPIKLSGYGGIGAQRYQIGHSGDTLSSWECLNFQPEFTNTAANVGFGYWSHDIGGFYDLLDSSKTTSNAELFVRWVQFGVFSPIFRTHCDFFGERRFFAFQYPYSSIARDYMQFRKTLVPYLYSSARIYHETGIPFFRPLYFEWPNESDSFKFKNEYLFGSDILVFPVTTPARDSAKVVSCTKMWLPPGFWIHMKWLKSFHGPKTITFRSDISEIPVLIRSGAVIPQCRPIKAGEIPKELIFSVYPFAEEFDLPTDLDWKSKLYEDDGFTTEYLSGKFSVSGIAHSQSADSKMIRVCIGTPIGNFNGSLLKRDLTFNFYGILPPTFVTSNGVTCKFVYDDSSLILTVKTHIDWSLEMNKSVIIEVGQNEISTKQRSLLLSGIPGIISRGLLIKRQMDTGFDFPRFDWPKSLYEIMASSAHLRNASKMNPGNYEEIFNCMEMINKTVAKAKEEVKPWVLAGTQPWKMFVAVSALLSLIGDLEPELLINKDTNPEKNSTTTNKTKQQQQQNERCEIM